MNSHVVYYLINPGFNPGGYPGGYRVGVTTAPLLHVCTNVQPNECEMLVPTWEYFERASQ